MFDVKKTKEDDEFDEDIYTEGKINGAIPDSDDVGYGIGSVNDIIDQRELNRRAKQKIDKLDYYKLILVLVIAIVILILVFVVNYYIRNNITFGGL